MGETSTTVHPWVAEAASQVRFGIVPAFLAEWQDLCRFVVDAEERGFDSTWVNDHPTRSMDTFTLLGALATATRRIRLMSLVSCVLYHHPLMIARGAADVDRLSGGRAVVGLGIGDDVPEFEMLGLDFPPARARQAALEEAIPILRALWAGEEVTHSGERFHLASAKLSPRPVQERLPVLIGGGGEKVTLRQVARHADMSNFGPHEWVGSAFSPEDVRRKYDILRRYCEEEGRPYEAILRSHWTPLLTLAPSESALQAKQEAARIPDAKLRTGPLFATPDSAIAHYQGLLEAGAQYFLVTVNGRDTETVDLLSERVMPALEPRP
ncbi:MAG: class flavin-dependent oxidoreductase [Acidimicrobiaceae bacterium]|nr:class flavin-dependent oxidoreductase [Acidimicrobiaceae bacterium]